MAGCVVVVGGGRGVGLFERVERDGEMETKREGGEKKELWR